MGRVVLPIGYFANVIEVDGIGLALCTDGVGSKTIIADMMGKYDTIGIDCVAMNVNDMICVGAKPVSMVDYIAVEQADAAMLDAIGAGLCEGAEMAGISISGGETAQLKDIVNGFDLVGMAVGRVDLDKVIVGKDVAPATSSSACAATASTATGSRWRAARSSTTDRYTVDHRFDELGVTIGEELLRPTDIYVPEAMEILANVRRREGAHQHHQRRPAQPGAGRRAGRLRDRPPDRAASDLRADPAARRRGRRRDVRGVQHGDRLLLRGRSGRRRVRRLAILRKHGRQAQRIGPAVADPEKTVRISERGLVGRHKTFRKA